MRAEDIVAQRIRRALAKDYALLSYHLPYNSEVGYLEVDGEKTETPYWSFTHITDIVKKEFERRYRVQDIYPIGFRGEVYVSEEKELEIYASGGVGLIQYTVRSRKVV